jgi:hypothetical protein
MHNRNNNKENVVNQNKAANDLAFDVTDKLESQETTETKKDPGGNHDPAVPSCGHIRKQLHNTTAREEMMQCEGQGWAPVRSKTNHVTHW